MANPYFFQLLEQENIVFDQIFTDNKILAQSWNSQLLDQHLVSLFEKQEKQKSWLIILDQLVVEDILPFVDWVFDTYCIVDAWSGVASLGRKIAPDLHYLDQLGARECYFPFDENSFLKALKWSSSSIVFLTNQEVPENIYASYDEEELQFVDKSLIDQPQFLSLLDPEQPNFFLIGTGNHLEELIKLSQLLSVREEKIALGVIGNLSVLKSSEIQQKLNLAKKVWIVLDHEKTDIFPQMLGTKQEIAILTPDYQHITSISADWSFAQAGFDAEALLRKVVALY